MGVVFGTIVGSFRDWTQELAILGKCKRRQDGRDLAFALGECPSARLERVRIFSQCLECPERLAVPSDNERSVTRPLEKEYAPIESYATKRRNETNAVRGTLTRKSINFQQISRLSVAGTNPQPGDVSLNGC